MERIDFSKIAMQSAREYKIKTIRSEIARIGGLEKVLLTDCLSNKDRDGLLVMRTLDDFDKQNGGVLRYKIKVLKDIWGNPVYPEDIVEWKFERKTRDMFGHKITNRQFKEYVRRGEQREIEVWHEAIVDEKGCIDVPFKDAAILLNTRGVHFMSNQPLTHFPERDRKVTRDHYDPEFAKTMGIHHYWRYSECPPWIYETLPKIKKPRKTKTDSDNQMEIQS